MGWHSHEHPKAEHSRPLLISLLLNVLITVLQVIFGFLSGSLALLSDALHNASDVFSLIVAFTGERLALRHSDVGKTFGMKRARILAALFNALLLLGLSFVLIKEALFRFFNPTLVEGFWVVVFAAAGIVVNGLSAYLLHANSKHSLNIRAAYLHLFSDMLTSIVVMLSGLAMIWWEVYWVDSLATVLIAVYLIYASWSLLSKTLGVIMQYSPPHIHMDEIKDVTKDFPELANIHHVHIWQLTDQELYFEAHIDFCDDLPLSRVSQVSLQLREKIRQSFGIAHVTLQAEYGVDDSKNVISTHCS